MNWLSNGWRYFWWVAWKKIYWDCCRTGNLSKYCKKSYYKGLSSDSCKNKRGYICYTLFCHFLRIFSFVVTHFKKVCTYRLFCCSGLEIQTGKWHKRYSYENTEFRVPYLLSVIYGEKIPIFEFCFPQFSPGFIKMILIK